MNASVANMEDPLVDRVVGEQRIARPARALLGVTALGLLWSLYTLAASVMSLVSRVDMPYPYELHYRFTLNGQGFVETYSVDRTPLVFLATSLVEIAVGVFIVVALRGLQARRGRWLGVAAAAVGMIPALGSAWPLAIPFGVWLLVGLLSPFAKRWFS